MQSYFNKINAIVKTLNTASNSRLIERFSGLASVTSTLATVSAIIIVVAFKCDALILLQVYLMCLTNTPHVPYFLPFIFKISTKKRHVLLRGIQYTVYCEKPFIFKKSTRKRQKVKKRSKK